MVSAAWSVPLDGETRSQLLCLGEGVDMEFDGCDFSDYFYCTSEAESCGLGFVSVILKIYIIISK